MTTSNNPEKTSGRAAAAAKTMTYPTNELVDKFVALRFVEYRRDTAGDRASDTPTTTIHLPLPQDIPETSQIKSGATSMFDFFGIASEGRNYLESSAGENALDRVKAIREQFGSDIPKEVAYAVALTPTLSDDTRLHAGVVAGVVKNPHTTAFFDGMELRSFTLTWVLSARSQADSDTINNILNTIRERIHPEEALGGYALEYPDLVYVDFEGDIKNYLPKFNKCFVNNLTISTSTGDSMVFFKSGAPVTVQIAMTFTETSIVTRNTLRKGV